MGAASHLDLADLEQLPRRGTSAVVKLEHGINGLLQIARVWPWEGRHSSLFDLSSEFSLI